MATLRLRDRDAIITEEDLIFRVFGYFHPSNAYICDAEYAPAKIFKSNNPRAPRTKEQETFYKFYEDEGWRFVHKNLQQYTIFHEMISKRVVGINNSNIVKVRRPKEKLERHIEVHPKDELLAALQNALKLVTQTSTLTARDFGIFGSILHGFHHPRFSDIDLIIYGGENLVKLKETLIELIARRSSLFRNEFETEESVSEKRWKFRNYSPKEYFWHQKRKMIYALFNDEQSRRLIKTEFEPVRDWDEIINEYDVETKMMKKGWTRMCARVVEDRDVPYIPSIYNIEPLEVLSGTRDAIEVRRIISYMEEFRMQACKDEIIYVEGNLEKVATRRGDFYQVALTYCPRYYEQVMKVVS